MIKSFNIILHLCFTTVLVTGAITITLFSFIATAQAELKGISEKIELLPYKTTKDNENDISDQLTIIKQAEKNTLTENENISVYKGLGIKLENFSPWTILATSDKSTCYNIDLCFIDLGILNGTTMPQTWIIKDNFESQTIKEYCKCNTLEDYERHFYTNMISHFDNFSLINENQTTLSGGNKSAIQLEYEFAPNNTKIHTFTIFTINNDDDSFYQFTYYADPESYSKYFPDFKKIIDTVKFASDPETHQNSQIE